MHNFIVEEFQITIESQYKSGIKWNGKAKNEKHFHILMLRCIFKHDIHANNKPVTPWLTATWTCNMMRSIIGLL